MPYGGARRHRRRQRLLKGAVGHTERIENELAHQSRERPAKHVDHDLLSDCGAAAGIAERQAGHQINDHLRRIRGRHALQHLKRRRPWSARRIAAKAVHSRAGDVAEQLTQRDARLPAAIGRHSPGGEIAVHVGVEIERALFNQTHHREREHRLADRSGLEWRRRRYRVRRSHHAHAEAARPYERAVIDHADARAGRRVVLHALRERLCWAFAGRNCSLRPQVSEHARHALIGAHRQAPAIATSLHYHQRKRAARGPPFRNGTAIAAYSAAMRTSGAAARTSASTCFSYLTKFSWNMRTSLRAVSSNAALSFQVFIG